MMLASCGRTFCNKSVTSGCPSSRSLSLCLTKSRTHRCEGEPMAPCKSGDQICGRSGVRGRGPPVLCTTTTSLHPLWWLPANLRSTMPRQISKLGPSDGKSCLVWLFQGREANKWCLLPIRNGCLRTPAVLGQRAGMRREHLLPTQATASDMIMSGTSGQLHFIIKAIKSTSASLTFASTKQTVTNRRSRAFAPLHRLTA